MKKVCVVTGSRADYGLLRCVMAGLRDSQHCALQVIATGMHLASEFGYTWRHIEDDGFDINWKVEMLVGADTEVAVTKSVGLAMTGFADAFAALKPDLVLLLGDRFEIFAAASSATLAGIPIAHLHGGEITEGSVDDTIRHAITKMSSLHFTAAEDYRQRVIQLGEAPDTVWNVGGFGVDAALNTPLLARAEVEERLGLVLGDTTLLITFHPETGRVGTSAQSQMMELLAALEQVDASLVFTMPNADVGGRGLFELLQVFVSQHSARACVHTSLGQTLYLSVLALSAGVVGNSSSGLIEAPAFGVGTVNIGSRQDGRLKSASVIDCAPNRRDIIQALGVLLRPETRSRNAAGIQNPYGQGGAVKRTVTVIEGWEPQCGNKRFYDLNFASDEAGRVAV
jgi:GDP/UDP-N,N'-diacetylbacillosamine 2-epimerase (hydrolysing)